MKERPILFSGEMVRAILEGRKTQTRRVIKPQPHPDVNVCTVRPDGLHTYQDRPSGRYHILDKPDGARCPYVRPGDLLWVRETWQAQNLSGQWWHEVPRAERELYNWSIIDRAECEDREPKPPRWIPSIFMPRWASRLTLKVTAVRVERVCSITRIDAQKEGIDICPCCKGYHDLMCRCRDRFRKLWDSINAKRGFGWDANPWVWVVEFERWGDGD